MLPLLNTINSIFYLHGYGTHKRRPRPSCMCPETSPDKITLETSAHNRRPRPSSEWACHLHMDTSLKWDARSCRLYHMLQGESVQQTAQAVVCSHATHCGSIFKRRLHCRRPRQSMACLRRYAFIFSNVVPMPEDDLSRRVCVRVIYSPINLSKSYNTCGRHRPTYIYVSNKVWELPEQSCMCVLCLGESNSNGDSQGTA